MITLGRRAFYLNVVLPQRYFRKKGCDCNACNNVRDILYNTDAINSIVKWIVHSPVGKLVYTNNIYVFLSLVSPCCEQT